MKQVYFMKHTHTHTLTLEKEAKAGSQSCRVQNTERLVDRGTYTTPARVRVCLATVPGDSPEPKTKQTAKSLLQ